MTFSRRNDYSGYSRPYLDGIGPYNIVATHRYRYDSGNNYPMHTQILHPDGHLLLSESGPRHRVVAFDNEHFYVNEGGNFICYGLDGTQQWSIRDTGTCVTPLEGRGIAIWINNGSYVQSYLDIYSDEGQLEEHIRLIPFYSRGTKDYSVYVPPVFDVDSLAIWKVSWLDYNPYGSFQAGTYLFSEAIDGYLGFRYSSGYSGEDYQCSNICGSGMMTTDMNNVLAWTCRYAVLFDDLTFETELWRESFGDYGYSADGYACCDPFGACSFLTYRCDVIEQDYYDYKYLTFKVTHIDLDGSSWTRVLDEWDPEDWRIEDDDLKVHGLICDSLGNLYLGVSGRVVSYSPDGELRWDMNLSEDDVEVRAIDSRGTLYVTERTYSQSRLFALSDREPERPKVRAKLRDNDSGVSYRPGDEVRFYLHPYNFGESETVDFCMAVLLPNGTLAFWGGSAWTETSTAWFENLLLPNSFEMIDLPLSLGTVPEGSSEGIYTMFVGFTRPGTFETVSELFPVEFEVRPE